MDSEFCDDDAAVSPVISTILMVAIAVILAAVVATFTLGFLGSVNDTAPQAQFSATVSADGTVALAHTGGDNVKTEQLYVTYDNGRLALSDLTGKAELTAGDTVNLPGPTDGDLDVIYEARDTSATLVELDTGGGSMFADTFCTDTSSEYSVVEEEDRESGAGFTWNTGACLLQSNGNNDDLTATWTTDVANPDDVRVATRMQPVDDDDGGGVVIKTDSTQYQAIVTDDYPAGSGIYERSSSGDDLGVGDRRAPTDNDYAAENTWHRVALTYNGTHLRMFVDGNLEATHAASITPERVGIVSAANDVRAEYEYVSVYSE